MMSWCIVPVSFAPWAREARMAFFTLEEGMMWMVALDCAPVVGLKKQGVPVQVPSSVGETWALRPRRLERKVGRMAAIRGPRRKDQEMGRFWGVSNGGGRGRSGVVIWGDFDWEGVLMGDLEDDLMADRKDRWKARPEGPSPMVWEYSKEMKHRV